MTEHKPPPGVMEIKTLDDLIRSPPTVKCPKCEVINNTGVKFCAWCNSPLPKSTEDL